jgi:hypothetical protein
VWFVIEFNAICLCIAVADAADSKEVFWAEFCVEVWLSGCLGGVSKRFVTDRERISSIVSML